MSELTRALQAFRNNALSPLDGRYADKLEFMSRYFSEFALVKARFEIEIRWFRRLVTSDGPMRRDVSQAELDSLDRFLEAFSEKEMLAYKEIERKINHDVKPVEYILKTLVSTDVEEHFHFGITSEDVNNLSYALNFKRYVEQQLVPHLDDAVARLSELARRSADMPMLGRTHGQPATPTTMGKELAYFAYRLSKVSKRLKQLSVEGKLSGAVGNWAALVAACPHIDWMQYSEEFVRSLGLEFNPVTKQIEPHDWLVRFGNEVRLAAQIVVDACKDIWLYGAEGYLKQKAKEEEVGSSTMPHKVNPIDFENCWGNMQVASAFFSFFAEKLPVTFLQRDLSDSTVLRNIGVAFGHFELALLSFGKGLGKLAFNREAMLHEVDLHPEVLAEAIQTVMRKNGVQGGYELLKTLTRNRAIEEADIVRLIKSLAIDEEDKQRLLDLKPHLYTGHSEQMVRRFLDN